MRAVNNPPAAVLQRKGADAGAYHHWKRREEDMFIKLERLQLHEQLHKNAYVANLSTAGSCCGYSRFHQADRWLRSAPYWTVCTRRCRSRTLSFRQSNQMLERRRLKEPWVRRRKQLKEGRRAPFSHRRSDAHFYLSTGNIWDVSRDSKLAATRWIVVNKLPYFL